MITHTTHRISSNVFSPCLRSSHCSAEGWRSFTPEAATSAGLNVDSQSWFTGCRQTLRLLIQHYPSAYVQTFARQAALPWNWTLCLHDILQSTWPSVVLADKANEPLSPWACNELCSVTLDERHQSLQWLPLHLSSLSNRRSSSRFAHSMTLTEEVKVASCCATVGRTRLCLLLHPLLLHRPHCSLWVRLRALFPKATWRVSFR